MRKGRPLASRRPKDARPATASAEPETKPAECSKAKDDVRATDQPRNHILKPIRTSIAKPRRDTGRQSGLHSAGQQDSIAPGSRRFNTPIAWTRVPSPREAWSTEFQFAVRRASTKKRLAAHQTRRPPAPHGERQRHATDGYELGAEAIHIVNMPWYESRPAQPPRGCSCAALPLQEPGDRIRVAEGRRAGALLPSGAPRQSLAWRGYLPLSSANCSARESPRRSPAPTPPCTE